MAMSFNSEKDSEQKLLQRSEYLDETRSFVEFILHLASFSYLNHLQ